MQPIETIYAGLDSPKKTVITMHQKPDADAMGSALGLYHFLRSFGHEVRVISPTNWARWLDWMDGIGEVLDYETAQAPANALIEEADWLFCLDFNHLGRTKAMAPKLAAATGLRILIDHHQEPDLPSFGAGVSNAAKSSTCEMIYDVISGSGHRARINKTIAECLYAGVTADTGSFRFSSTGAGVHHMVAYLKEQGLEHTRVHEALYDNFMENRIRFLGHVLTNRLEVLYDHNAALMYITRQDLLRYNIRTGDTEGLVNYPLSIQGIRLSAIVVDRDEERKWSFRSKGGFDCNTFARTYFSGGGHFNASGGSDKASVADTVARFKAILQENKNLLQ